jgi:uncharacterized repeat protein (TIGR02543 family)
MFLGVLLTIIGALFMLGIAGCDNGTTTTTVTQHTVTFNADGGQVSPGTRIVEEGKTIDPLPIPTKTEGETVFQGWYTKNGTDGDWGKVFTTITPITDDITLYAKWGITEPTKFIVTFDPDGGSISSTKIEINSGEKIGTLPKPEKTDFIFGGWYTEKNGEEISFTEDTIIDASITVYARWRSSPIQVYSINDDRSPVVYNGRDFDFYFSGNPQKNIAAEVRNGKVTFIYSKLSDALLQTVIVGQNGITGVNPPGAKIALDLKLKFDNGEELALQNDNQDGVGIVYTDKDVSITYTFNTDSNPVTMNLKKGWNFVFYRTGEAGQDPEGFDGYYWVFL